MVSPFLQRNDASRLDSFETRLQRDPHARFEESLPPESEPNYLAIATELIRLDMEYAWGRGEPRSPEHYLSRCPVLGRDPASLESVAFEDYRLRKLAGMVVTPQAYASRFGISTFSWPIDPEIDDAEESDPLFDLPATSTPPPSRSVDSLRTSVLAGACAVQRELREAEANVPLADRSGFPAIGTAFSGFQLIDELGRGTFGRVYLARQEGLAGRTVALKLARRLFTESQTLAQLQHTNIVPIHSMHDDGKMQAVCMPFLGRCTLLHVLAAVRKHDLFPTRGEELLGTLKQGRTSTRDDAATSVIVNRPNSPQPVRAESTSAPETVRSWSKLAGMSYVDAALWIGSQLAAGLAHAHERGILHRDLKPANVLLTDDGVPMLLDFNIAEDVKLRGRSDTVIVGGTLPYMSPEQMAGYAGDLDKPIDGRADVFGLGAILFELLTGTRPFPDHPGDGPASIAAMLADREQGPPRLRSLNPHVPPSVECIVRKCLEPNPDARYRSADELAGDLVRHLQNEPLRNTVEPSIRERVRKWVRRHPRLTSTSTVAAASLLLVGVLAASLYTVRERSHAFEARVALGEHARDLKSIHEQLGDRNQTRESLDRGLELCRASLARYEVSPQDEAPRSDSRLMRHLPAEDQLRVKDDIGEVFYLMAKSAAHRAEMSVDASDRSKHLEDAARWNRMAESWGLDRIPRAIREQRADLSGLAGDEAGVREWRTRAASAPPASPRDRYLLGYWHHHQGRFRQAAPELEAATSATPDSFPAWFVRGSNHLAMQENDLAAMCLTACVALRPDFAPVWMNRGIALARLNKLDLARADYETALRLTPANPDLHVLCAGLDQSQNQHAKAVERFTKALASPRCPSRVRFHRAASRRALGDLAGAEADEAEGLKTAPTDELSWVSRAEIRAAKGDVDGALADVDAALDVNPRSLEAMQMKAHLLSEKKQDLAAAIRVLDRAVKHYPESVPLLAGRGVLRARTGDRTGAHRDAEDALQRDSGGVNLYQVGCIYALTTKLQPSDRFRACELVAAALRKGFGAEYLASDADLDPLRSSDEFKKLTTDRAKQ